MHFSGIDEYDTAAWSNIHASPVFELFCSPFDYTYGIAFVGMWSKSMGNIGGVQQLQVAERRFTPELCMLLYGRDVHVDTPSGCRYWITYPGIKKKTTQAII